MFRHKKNQADAIAAPASIAEEKSKMKAEADFGKADLRELVVKNLKWSQIIYEQNRKINRKLAWSATANWLKLFIILAPLLVALWYLPPLIQKAAATYNSLLNPSAAGAGHSQSLEQILKLLPLNSAQQQQIKVMLK